MDQVNFHMPDMDQLINLIKDKYLPPEVSEPQIDLNVFPSAPCWVWSREICEHSSIYGMDPSQALLMDFNVGFFDHSKRDYVNQVLLVREGVQFDPEWPQLDAKGRWFDCGEGLAFDCKTGLQWQRFMVGQSWVDGKPTGNAEELTHIEALKRYGNLSAVNDAKDSQETPYQGRRNTPRLRA